jgi:flagellar biosynthesis/type III secretory pathway M-ring protein FliF/YscJ
MFLAIVCYHLLTFTDYIPQKETQYLMGKSFMLWIVLLLAINLFFVVKEIFRLFSLNVRKIMNAARNDQTIINESPNSDQVK